MKYLYTQDNGNRVIDFEDGRKCSINAEEYPELWEETSSYLADHPEALVPEPAPPEPTAAEVEAARVAGIRAKLDELDRKAVRPLRAVAAGTATDADRSMLAEIETQAAELRASI